MLTDKTKNIQIGAWTVDEDSLRLIKADSEVKLQPKLMSLLLLLASKPGCVFSRDAITEEIWPETSATDDTINNAIGRLRKLLSADQEQEKYIETIAKLGYRLCARVTHTQEGSQATIPAEMVSQQQVKRPLTTWLMLVIAVLIVASGVIFFVVINKVSTTIVSDQNQKLPLDLQQPLREILISNQPESELFPSVAPSGEEVVFVRIAQTMDSTELVVKHIDEQNEITLTDSKGLYTNPVWSPDGQHIAYIELAESGCRVMSISARGGPSSFVSNCSQRLVSTLRPTLAWSPNGQFLIVPMPVPDKKSHALFQVNIATKVFTQITFPPEDSLGDASPAFSPSGDRLAFTRTSEFYTDQVIVVTNTSTATIVVEEHIAPLLGITWLNHNTLLMSSAERNIYEMWSLQLDTKERRLLGIGGHGMVHPQFNTQQRTLVMAEIKANADIVIRQQTDNGPSLVKELVSTQWERAASISNNQNLAGFIRLIPDGSELWIHDIKENKSERLLKTDKFIAGISWSADDQKMALSVAADTKMHIEIYERDSRRHYKLAIKETNNQQYPVWTSNGQSLIYSSESNKQWSIWKTDIADLNTTMLLQDGGTKVSLNENNQLLYFTKQGETGLWQYALNASPLTNATRISEKITANIILWDYADGYFYYVKEMRQMMNTIYKFDPKLDNETVFYQGMPFNEMDIKGDYIITSDIKELSGDVYLRQYKTNN